MFGFFLPSYQIKDLSPKVNKHVSCCVNFLEWRNKSLNWCGFSYDSSLFKTAQYFLCIFGCPVYSKAEPISFTKSPPLIQKQGEHLFIESLLCGKKKGTWAILFSFSRSFSTAVTYYNYITCGSSKTCSQDIVEVSEGMSWDMINFCQSKSILGQNLFFLRNLYCVPMFYAGNPLDSWSFGISLGSVLCSESDKKPAFCLLCFWQKEYLLFHSTSIKCMLTLCCSKLRDCSNK